MIQKRLKTRGNLRRGPITRGQVEKLNNNQVMSGRDQTTTRANGSK